MPITARLVLSNATPEHGETITATYVVDGNDGVPPEVIEVSGAVDVGGQPFDLAATLTRPAVDPMDERYGTPSAPGLTFHPTSDPAVFEALIP